MFHTLSHKSNLNMLSPCSFLQTGKLPRNLPALRAMEMAQRTNSFATATPTAGGGQQAAEDSDDSEMEYMIPLHSE